MLIINARRGGAKPAINYACVCVWGQTYGQRSWGSVGDKEGRKGEVGREAGANRWLRPFNELN